VREKDLLSLID